MKLSMNYIIVIVTIMAFVIGNYIPIYLKSFLYALSLTIKECIIFILPLIIFSFLFNLIERLKVGAVKLLVWFIVLMTLSNLFSITVANIIGRIIITKIHVENLSAQAFSSDALKALWNFELPVLIQSKYLMPFSITLAAIINYFTPEKALQLNNILKKVSMNILTKVILPIIPIFIFGAVIKMNHDAILIPIFKNYAIIFIAIIICSWTYLMIAALIITKNDFGMFMKNMAPTIVAGFTTMSSAVSLPLLFESINKTTKKDTIVNSLLSTAGNFHMVGDCFIISIFATVILYTFNGALPSIVDHATFVMYFVFMKYAFAGIPGGGVIVMMPILKSVLMFNSEMTSIIMTMYILFDPIGTATNLMGNGVFMMFLRKFFHKKFGY